MASAGRSSALPEAFSPGEVILKKLFAQFVISSEAKLKLIAKDTLVRACKKRPFTRSPVRSVHWASRCWEGRVRSSSSCWRPSRRWHRSPSSLSSLLSYSGRGSSPRTYTAPLTGSPRHLGKVTLSTGRVRYHGQDTNVCTWWTFVYLGPLQRGTLNMEIIPGM